MNRLLLKKVFNAHLDQGNPSHKTWCYRVKMFYQQIELDICLGDRLAERATLITVNTKLQVYFNYFENCWREKLDAEFARGGPDAGGNKLRTYRRFKESYTTEQYVRIIIQKKYKSAYTKFRCGVAPIKLETGRYGLNRVPVDQRLCEECNVVVIMYTCTVLYILIYVINYLQRSVKFHVTFPH